IANFGPAADYERLFEAAESILRKHPTNSIVWLIQARALAVWTRDAATLAAWLRRFHQVRRIRGVQVETGDCAVVERSGANARALMILLRSLGVGVSLPGNCGWALVEVHRPKGIVVGMAGRAFEGTSDRSLRVLNLERDKAEGLPDAAMK